MDNFISISRNYTTDFECHYKMHYYPFDVQHCSMEFMLGVSMYNKLKMFVDLYSYIKPEVQYTLLILNPFQGTVGKLVELKKGQLTYRGGIDLTQYYIVSRKIVEIEPWNQKSNGNWKVKVRSQGMKSCGHQCMITSHRLKSIWDGI